MNKWVLKQYGGVYDEFMSDVSISKALKSHIMSRLHSLSVLGNRAKAPVSKPLTGSDKIFELRAKDGVRQVRFLFCFLRDKVICILYCLFKKKSMTKEIRQAEKHRTSIIDNMENTNDIIH